MRTSDDVFPVLMNALKLSLRIGPTERRKLVSRASPACRPSYTRETRTSTKIDSRRPDLYRALYLFFRSLCASIDFKITGKRLLNDYDELLDVPYYTNTYT